MCSAWCLQDPGRGLTNPPVSSDCSEDIIRRQGQVDKQYAGLRELAEDRRRKLDHTYHHFLLSREVEDLEHWISERDLVASSQEMGQDLDHVTVTEPQNQRRCLSDTLVLTRATNHEN